jgi:uracil-DNA glycosylase
MRTALTALTDELRRLKADGVTSVSVSDESIATLRRVVAARRAAAPVRAPAEIATAAPAASTMTAAKSESETRAAAPAVAGWQPSGPALAPARTVAKNAAPAGPAIPPPKPFALPAGDKAARMAALREHVFADEVCRAHVRSGRKLVIGVGSLEARIMFVGEAPGAEEEVQGEPFVGPAGQLLTKMIGAMGLRREDVYIGNIMNWRPEMPVGAGGVQYGNRPPTPDELLYCLPHLRAQIDIVNPELLVALGSTAAQGLLGVGAFKALGEVRGRWREFAGKPLMITYHPSYILRNQSNRSKRMIWEDLLQVMERAGLPLSEKQRGYFLDK